LSKPSIADPISRAWVSVDLGAMIENARTVARISGVPLLPMVKANGYGLGAAAVARALESINPWGYGVVTPGEGAELRRAGIQRPIVVFSPLLPAQIPAHREHRLRPVIGDLEGLRAWLAAGTEPFHLEVDTGMSRTGFRWTAATTWRDLAQAAPGWEGIFTHFAAADSDQASAHRQWRRFQAVLEGLSVRPPLVHAANSAAALLGKTYACDLVRPGIFLYGGNVAGYQAGVVARFEAQVVAQREVRAGDSVSYGGTWTARRDAVIATVSAGYADGVLRSLSNQGAVEIAGRVVPIVGRVTMDFFMVALERPCEAGAAATIFGGLISVDEQARRGGTIPYELLTGLGNRVERRHSGVE
jgi:alanine racemase